MKATHSQSDDQGRQRRLRGPSIQLGVDVQSKEQGRLLGGGAVFLVLSSLGVVALGKQWGNVY